MEQTIKDLRQANKMTMLAVAIDANMSLDGYRRIESGECSSHRKKTIANLSRTFNVSENDIKDAIKNTKKRKASHIG